MGQLRPLLSFIFGLFKQISLQFLQQIYEIQRSFKSESDVFITVQKFTKTLGYFCKKNLQQRNLKNRPIWSHWLLGKYRGGSTEICIQHQSIIYQVNLIMYISLFHARLYVKYV